MIRLTTIAREPLCIVEVPRLETQGSIAHTTSVFYFQIVNDRGLPFTRKDLERMSLTETQISQLMWHCRFRKNIIGRKVTKPDWKALIFDEETCEINRIGQVLLYFKISVYR